MIVVEAVIWYWTSTGMIQRGLGTGYIEKAEVVRLLEEAHKRGYEKAKEET